MEFKFALAEAMRRNGVKDEEVAIALGVRANTVARWRTGDRVPTGPLWQALRDKLPHFADLIDGNVAVA